MTMSDALRRFMPCLYPAREGEDSVATTAPAATVPIGKKRLSSSLRDDLDDDGDDLVTVSDQDSTTTSNLERRPSSAPSRPSRSMVIGTIFGQRRGHVWFCIQHHRLSTKPTLLLELAIPTHQLVQEMRYGVVRIALECDRSELSACPLNSVPLWTMFCNGRKSGFAARRNATHNQRAMLKAMQSSTVGAGVIPAGFCSPGSEEIMYMRANYEHVVGDADSQSFHLVNPDECTGQELSIFLMRSG